MNHAIHTYKQLLPCPLPVHARHAGPWEGGGGLGEGELNIMQPCMSITSLRLVVQS